MLKRLFKFGHGSEKKSELAFCVCYAKEATAVVTRDEWCQAMRRHDPRRGLLKIPSVRIFRSGEDNQLRAFLGEARTMPVWLNLDGLVAAAA